MIKKLLAIVLLLHIGLCFAQNSPKLPPSPFSFMNGQTALNNSSNLKDAGLPQIVLSSDLGSNSNINNGLQANIQTSNANSLTTTSLDIPEAKRKEYLDNMVERLVNPLNTQWEKYGKVIQQKTLDLFVYFLYFVMLFRLIKFLVQGQYDLTFFLIDTILLVVIMKIISLLIINADTVSLSVINIFRDIARDATGIKDIKPSMLLEVATKYVNDVCKFVFTLSFQDLLKGLVFASLAIATFIIIGGLVIRYVVAIFEAMIIVKVSVVYLAFYGLEQLRDLSIKPIVQWINIGVKLMFLQLMIGLELSILNDFIKPNEINIYMILSVFMSSFMMLVITWTIPKILDNIILGSVNSSNSSVSAIKNAANVIQQGVTSLATNLVKNAGGASQLIKAHQNYQQALKNHNSVNMPTTSNNSSGTNNLNPKTTSLSTSNQGFDTKQNNISNSSNLPNSEIQKQSNQPINQDNVKNSNSQNALSENNTSSVNSSTGANNSSKLGNMKAFAGDVAKGAIDMGKKSIGNAFGQTPAGKLATHFDSKTQELQKQTAQAQIDNYYKELRQGFNNQNTNQENSSKNIDTSNNVTNTIEKFKKD
ncbi:MAG: hypothetical protein RLZZ210_618 [Pseudomonadota bacterium]|jgi:P-type conjugative transfer protein TrbL